MTRAAADSAARPSRISSLDGIRALAIAVVVLYHLHFHGFAGGFLGVNVFFVISGYLITSLLLKEHDRTASINLARFWVRRFLRLYPTLLAVVIVGFSLWFVIGDYEYSNLSAGAAALIALTYTGNFMRAYGHLSQGIFAPSWSLAMEEQFYLVWPPILLAFLYRGISRRAMAIVLGIVVVVACALSVVLFHPSGNNTPDIYFSPITSVPPLVTGVVLALVMTLEPVKRFFSGAVGWIASVGGFVALVYLLMTLSSDWKQNAMFFGVTFPGVGVVTAIMIAGLVSTRSPASALLSWKPLAWFGKNVSYSLYLWHMLVAAALAPFVSGFVGQLELVAGSIAVSIASHYVIEKPFLKLKGRFEPASWSAKPARASEPATEQAVTAG